MSDAPEHFTVWAEIPVSDLDRAIEFYRTVFQQDLKKDEGGPNPMAMFQTKENKGVAGHLYPGKPAAEGSGATVHMLVPDNLEDSLDNQDHHNRCLFPGHSGYRRYTLVHRRRLLPEVLLKH